MTNYCTNRMKLSGPKQFIEAFSRNCLSSSAAGDIWLAPEKIIPIPAVLRRARPGGQAALGSNADIGIEIVTKRPRGVLGSEHAKRLGILNYDDLERWAAEKEPTAIELGRICLRAFEETGYWLERDWQIDNWGTRWIQDFEVTEQTDTSFEATFATPWSPADKLYCELAKRFPELSIEVSAEEEGASFSYCFSSHNGEIRQEWLTQDVGERVEADLSFMFPARLQSLPPTHIRHWFAELRITLAVADYPIYRPPHQGIEMSMSEREASENFEYFMSQRSTRIAHLRNLLVRFGVTLDFSEQTKRALDKWIFRYGGFLYVHESEPSSFLTHNPGWTGARVGLNVIFDLAVFLGEFAISVDPGLRWELFTDAPIGMRNQNYRKPIIGGLRRRINMMRDVHLICRALRDASYMWQRPKMSVSRRKLCAEFASRTLMKMHRLAQGDIAGARRALRD